MTTKTIADGLRAELSNIEERQGILLADREQHSYDAIVSKDKVAIERVASINAALDKLKHEEAGLVAALKEAGRRETSAAEAERDAKRRSNAAAAADILLEAEDNAAHLAKDMANMSERALKLRAQFAEIRRLTGTGPTPESIQVNLGRSLTTAVMNSPMKIGHLAPGDRCSVDTLVEGWSKSIRNWIVAAVGDKPAQKAA
jgi:hypothetical protein